MPRRTNKMAPQQEPQAGLMTPEAREELRREMVEGCYRDLFGIPPEPGKPDQRTKTQQVVWNDLQAAGYMFQPVFKADKEGKLCNARAAIADGRRSLFLYIRANVLSKPELSGL